MHDLSYHRSCDVQVFLLQKEVHFVAWRVLHEASARIRLFQFDEQSIRPDGCFFLKPGIFYSIAEARKRTPSVHPIVFYSIPQCFI